LSEEEKKKMQAENDAKITPTSGDPYEGKTDECILEV